MLALTKTLGCKRLVRTQVCVFIRAYRKHPIPVAWEKPEFGWTKLNFDGSCRGREGRASIGGIFRNHRAEYLLGYAESIGTATSTVAEFAALKRGLELVLENGWTDLWLEGDAKTLVDAITKRSKVRCQEAKRHVGYISTVIPELNNCILTHVYREGNRAADKLAKLGQELETPRVWRDVPPVEVLHIVHEDAKGKIVLRRR